MQTQKKDRNSILWVEAVGFSLLIALVWLAEFIKLPHLLFDEPPVVSWRRALLRSVVVIAIWAWVFFITQRLLKRLHYLEEFLRICSWCRKVCHDDDWLSLEAYFNSKFATRTSHGMCPECMKKKIKELSLEQPSGSPTPAPGVRGGFKNGLN